MVVTVHLKTQSQPIVMTGVQNAYEKGSFYCIMFIGKKVVRKFPIQDIFDALEDNTLDITA